MDALPNAGTVTNVDMADMVQACSETHRTQGAGQDMSSGNGGDKEGRVSSTEQEDLTIHD